MVETSIARSAVAAPGFGVIAGIVIAGIVLGFIGPSEAAWLGAGGGLAVVILASVSRDIQDPLHPAHLELARFRRSERPAEILVVKLPPGPPTTRGSASRGSASAACSVLRVTDGVAIMPSLRGSGLCAVLEPDADARTAIEHRLRDVCGSEVGLGWASFPEDGVTLESLIAAAADRVPDPDRGRPHPIPPMPRMRPGQSLAPRTLAAGHPATAMKRAR
jgi:hypothetical protein